MNLLQVTCADVRRHILRLDELDAVKRGVVDIHLRRCKECARITAEFSIIETGKKVTHSEVTEEKQRDIYNRLVPAVHEITSRIPPPPSGESGHTLLGLNGKHWLTIAMFAVGAAIVSLFLLEYI